MSDENKYEFHYEIGSGTKLNPEFAVYTYRGQEYKIPMTTVYTLAELRELPYVVRKALEFWADMIHNPD